MNSSPLDRLLTTEDYIVVNKPGGLLTQAPPEIDSLEERVREWRRQCGDEDRRPYVGIPHRLDRPSSGAMLFGLNSKSTKALASQFEYREVEKTYWAIVSGAIDPAHGIWSDYMRKIPSEARSEIVDKSHENAQFARLRYRTILLLDDATLLEIALETGRTHQIRLQSASRDHPLWGDEMYGSIHGFGPEFGDARKRWIALHARSIAFKDPSTRRRVEITAPLPAYWTEIDELQGMN